MCMCFPNPFLGHLKNGFYEEEVVCIRVFREKVKLLGNTKLLKKAQNVFPIEDDLKQKKGIVDLSLGSSPSVN